MNSLRAWLVVVAVGASLLTGVKPGVAADPTDVGSLKPGNSVAWPGQYVDTSEGPFVGNSWTLQTTDGGERLRVALDVVQDYKKVVQDDEDDDGTPQENDGTPHENADEGRNFRLQLLDEENKEAGLLDCSPSWPCMDVGTGYSTEIFVCFNGDPCEVSFDHGLDCSGDAAGAACGVVAPPFNCDNQKCRLAYGLSLSGDSAGEWTIQVSGDDIDGWEFRMRAMLERQPNPGVLARMDEPVLPNLRARPPFELTLDCTPTVGYGAFVRRGTCGTAALGAVDGVPPGCSAQEIAEIRDVEWCLRFSGGNENAGDGGLEIVADASGLTSEDGKVYANAVQVIRRGDETVVERRPAGQLVFEDSHGHWHYDGFMQYELLTAAGKKEVLARNEGLKRGWCPADEFISDWDSFNQVPRQSGPTTDPAACFLATPNAVFGQSAGWGDIYEWAREEQFVPFGVDETTGTPELGLYVLRETLDPGGLLLESDEDDNSAYAYFEVLKVDDADPPAIRIIERGYGRDPWDPHKRQV